MDSLQRRAGSSVVAVGTELQVCITAKGEHDVSFSRSFAAIWMMDDKEGRMIL